MRTYLKLSTVACVAAVATLSASSARASAFTPGDLVVTRSVYQGTAATVTVGQTLPPACSGSNCVAGGAIDNGTFPNVFENNTVDGSFGVTSPIFVDDVNVSGGVATVVNTVSVPTSLAVTSFSSKSEMGINLSTDGQYITFMGYVAAVNALDVSNSNTPNHYDPTNPVGSGDNTYNFPRAVVQIDANGNVQATPVNSYSGNNGRGAIFDTINNQYLLVGNAGNGTTPIQTIVQNTGVQTVTPRGGPESTVIGALQGVLNAATGYQYGYSVTENGFAADKSGKDDNFRGMTLFGNTLYVTKGSGSNGVNTVYQVGTAGTVPTAATGATTAISILPGFPATLAKAAGARFPFGLWFANATTLYVADEGDGKPADAATSTTSGLGKWILSGGVWENVYTLQAGLNLGVQYSVPGLPVALNPAADGLRALTGKVNGDGTVTLFAVTSTVSAAGDQGADSNQLVTITDNLAQTTLPDAGVEAFTVLQTAPFGQVLRGVSLAPVALPPPPTPAAPPLGVALLSTLMLGLGALFVGRKIRPTITAV